VELVILYEHIYEIYGGIQGASNNFLIESYEQGKPIGIRVVPRKKRGREQYDSLHVLANGQFI